VSRPCGSGDSFWLFTHIRRFFISVYEAKSQTQTSMLPIGGNMHWAPGMVNVAMNGKSGHLPLESPL
jgi:hypothetical protein